MAAYVLLRTGEGVSGEFPYPKMRDSCWTRARQNDIQVGGDLNENRRLNLPSTFVSFSLLTQEQRDVFAMYAGEVCSV